jgi:hypothetical protein
MNTTILLLLALGLIAAIYWFFIRPKKQNNSKHISEATGNQNSAANTAGKDERRLTPEELLNKAWDFLTIIAEKVLKMNSSTQNNILDIGRKLKNNGMVFTVMVDDGNSTPAKSPAKEKAAQEQKSLKSSKQQSK